MRFETNTFLLSDQGFYNPLSSGGAVGRAPVGVCLNVRQGLLNTPLPLRSIQYTPSLRKESFGQEGICAGCRTFVSHLKSHISNLKSQQC